jgi:hypothetical protein
MPSPDFNSHRYHEGPPVIEHEPRYQTPAQLVNSILRYNFTSTYPGPLPRPEMETSFNRRMDTIPFHREENVNTRAPPLLPSSAFPLPLPPGRF